MKVLLTGHDGYIGSVMARVLREGGHQVVGLDSFLFTECRFGQEPPPFEAMHRDIRDVQEGDLKGYDAVIHLAALCNDPLGDLNPDLTFAINHRASVRLAELSKAAGVPRFLFASSCSLYGVTGDEMLDENASFNPITPYGESKIRVERDVRHLADDRFSPTYLRNATAYGISPRLRLDVVINNLAAWAVTTGEVRIQSDGSPWRPLVHVEDFALAFLAVLEAPRDLVHNEAFNVGQTKENYRVRDLAEAVRVAVPGCTVTYAEGGGPDPRSYRVNCDKLARTLPEFRPRWTARKGVEDVVAAYRRYGLTKEQFLGGKYLRIRHIQRLQEAGRLDGEMRLHDAPHAAAGAAGGSR
jgi:nucleoside-diphosphate-sugar epimerase